MTESVVATEQPSTAVTPTDATVAQMLALIDASKGKLSFGEALDAVLSGEVKTIAGRPEAVKPIPITEAQKAALARIVDVYGQVAPSSARALSKEEQKALVEERDVIDEVLGLLAARKDKSIRETIANHLDRVAEKNGADEHSPKDRNGHYAIKQDEPVEGTMRKMQRSVSDPKATVSSAMLLDLHNAGVLDRAEYLSLTSVPEVSRTFDEAKARKAIKANPGLLSKIAQATTKPAPTTTIKVVPHKG